MRKRERDRATAAARQREDQLRAACVAEEEHRVALLGQVAQLEHEKAQLDRRLVKAKLLVHEAKEQKRAINEEIERLNKDLYEEAGKLVAEEVTEQREAEADKQQTVEEFERLRSHLLLEKDRCALAALQIKQLRQGGVSFELELGDYTISVNDELSASMEAVPVDFVVHCLLCRTALLLLTARATQTARKKSV